MYEMAAEGRVAPGNRSASRHSRASKPREGDRRRTPADEESDVDDGQFKKLVLGMLREMRRDTSSACRTAEAASLAAQRALAATDETKTAVDNLAAEQDDLTEKLEHLQARTAALESRPVGSAPPSESGFSVIDAGSGGARSGGQPPSSRRLAPVDHHHRRLPEALRGGPQHKGGEDGRVDPRPPQGTRFARLHEQRHGRQGLHQAQGGQRRGDFRRGAELARQLP